MMNVEQPRGKVHVRINDWAWPERVDERWVGSMLDLPAGSKDVAVVMTRLRAGLPATARGKRVEYTLTPVPDPIAPTIAAAFAAYLRGDRAGVIKALSGQEEVTHLWAWAMTACYGPGEIHPSRCGTDGRPTEATLAEFQHIARVMEDAWKRLGKHLGG